MLDRMHLSSEKEPLSNTNLQKEQLERSGEPRRDVNVVVDEDDDADERGKLAYLLQDLQSLQDTTPGNDGGGFGLQQVSEDQQQQIPFNQLSQLEQIAWADALPSDQRRQLNEVLADLQASSLNADSTPVRTLIGTDGNSQFLSAIQTTNMSGSLTPP